MSDGKSVCDGIGRAIKQIAAYASLQGSVAGPILSLKCLFKFANTKICGVQLFCVLATKIIENKFLEKRLEKSRTLS